MPWKKFGLTGFITLFKISKFSCHFVKRGKKIKHPFEWGRHFLLCASLADTMQPKMITLLFKQTLEFSCELNKAVNLTEK